MSIDTTTVTLDQWGDLFTMTDATFVKYNQMDVPLSYEKPPRGKHARAYFDRAVKAESEAATLRLQVAQMRQELEQVQRLANRLANRCLDGGL